LGYGDVGRTAGIYPVRGTDEARVVLLWRTPALHDFDRHNLAAQRRLISNLYRDMGWEMPRLLAELEYADDLYLDSISTIVMDSWTHGRVSLVGDAGAGHAPGCPAKPADRSCRHKDVDSPLACAAVGNGTGDPTASSATGSRSPGSHLLWRRSRGDARRGKAASAGDAVKLHTRSTQHSRGGRTSVILFRNSSSATIGLSHKTIVRHSYGRICGARE
jgi:hypothetical protein